MKAEDMGVIETGCDADLSQEAPAAQHGAQLGLEQLEGHLAAVAHVVGEIDGRHAARTKLVLDDVAAG
jgi:hypothetical protein